MYLPPEIVLMISRYLGPSDLGSLRRTCRWHWHVVHGVFTQAAISQRTHTTSLNSLRNLLRLSGSDFATEIKCLRLYPGTNKRQFASSPNDHDSHSLPLEDNSMLPVDRYHFSLLQEAFKKLKDLGEVVVADGDPPATELPCHFDDVLLAIKRAGLHCKFKVSLENKSQFPSAFGAPLLKPSSGNIIDSARPDNDTETLGYHFEMPGYDSETPEDSSDVIQSLKTLHLHTSGFEVLRYYNGNPAQLQYLDTWSPVLLLRRATGLQELKLVGNQDWLYDWILLSTMIDIPYAMPRVRTIPQPNSLSHLQNLHLEGVALPLSTLLRLVHKASSTLRQLTLSCVTLAPASSSRVGLDSADWDDVDAYVLQLWEVLLDNFRHSIELQFFGLSQLREFDGDKGVFQHAVAGKWSRGTQESWEDFLEQKMTELEDAALEDVTEEYHKLFAAGEALIDL